MRAMQLRAGAGDDLLMAVDVERPETAPSEVLVEVHAAGVIPTELDWWPSTHHPDGSPRQDAVPGHEFSGVIAGVGSDVHRWSVGQEIYGMNDWFAAGAMAEYCTALPASIATKPASLSHAEAATVPISALTAWQGMVDRAQVQPGERVLVQGGAGGVGMFAVQVAHLHGGRVTATTSASTLDLVLSLGAEDAIDYRSNNGRPELGQFDVVFDTVGGETRSRLPELLAPGGRLISVAADAEVTTDPVARAAYFIVEPNQSQLQQVAALIDAGRLKTFIKAEVPLADAGRAYAGQLATHSRYGKVVVQVRPG